MRRSVPSPLDGFMFELKQRKSSSWSLSENGNDNLKVDREDAPTPSGTSRQCGGGGDNGCGGDADFFVISVVSDQANVHSKKCDMADILLSSRPLPFELGKAMTPPSIPRRWPSMGSICSTSSSSSFDDYRHHSEVHLPPQEMTMAVPRTLMMVDWDPYIAALSAPQKVCGVSRWIACLNNSPRSRPTGPMLLSSPISSSTKQAAANKS
jgi:hypothetical protein